MIKFRAWDFDEKRMHDVLVIDWLNYLVDLDFGNIERPFERVKLMQYTGLKDKYGTEIYEGDILYLEPFKTHSNDRVVEHIDGAYHGKLIRNGYSKLLSECVYETKIIGNIYENLELLEAAE